MYYGVKAIYSAFIFSNVCSLGIKPKTVAMLVPHNIKFNYKSILHILYIQTLLIIKRFIDNKDYVSFCFH